MAYSSAITAMQAAIIRYIDSKIPKDINKAQTGIVDGKNIHFSTGRTFKYDAVTDIPFGDGDKVVCLVPDGSNTAAVVGKA